MYTYLPPWPFSMTSIFPLPKLLRPSNCWTVHLYHLMRNTRSVRPWDTMIKFISDSLSSGGWYRPILISVLNVSLNPSTTSTKPCISTQLFKTLIPEEHMRINITSDSIIHISRGFSIWKSVEETAIKLP